MDFRGIHDRLQAIDAPGLQGIDEPREPNPEVKKDPGRAGDPYVLVDAQDLPRFLEVCRDDERLAMDMLCDLTAVDPSADDENLWIIAQLISFPHHHRLAIKCMLPKAKLVMPTSAPVHRGAQWHEREAAEMYGITFEGHPDPRNILLPEDWVGFPMRKDYVYPDEYHGISCK